MMDGDWAERLRVMNEMRQGGIVCDFKIKVAKETLQVHREVLHTRSEYFRGMFDNDMKESQQGYYEITDAGPLIVRECISFMYTGCMNLSRESVIEVLKLSHLWLLDVAVSRCEKYMITNIDSTNCVTWMNQTNIYDLEEFRSKAVKFIHANLCHLHVHELSKSELQSLMKTAKKSSEKVNIRWALLKEEMNQLVALGKSVCHLLVKVPVESLSEYIYQESVLEDTHVSSCEACLEQVKSRRKIYSLKKKFITLNNYLELRKLAVQHGANRALMEIDSYIISNFRKLWLTEEFRKSTTEKQLLYYVCNIQRRCTKEEFAVLIHWFKEKPSRHSIFPELFLSKPSHSSSSYQQSLHNLKGPSRESGVSWLVTQTNCCFLRSLARKFSNQHTLNLADIYIGEHFSTVALSPDIANLSEDTVIKYLSSEPLYTFDGGLSVWNAFRTWVELLPRKRKQEQFLRIFELLQLQNMSLQTLQAISTNVVVRESPPCIGKLVETVFVRIADTNNVLAEQKELVANLKNLKTKTDEDGQIDLDIRLTELESRLRYYIGTSENLENRISRLETRREAKWLTVHSIWDAIWSYRLGSVEARLQNAERQLRRTDNVCTLL